MIFEKKLPQGIFRTYSQKPEFDFDYVKQIHSPIISHDQCFPYEADGLIRSIKDPRPVAIVTADCLPIIILGKEKYVFVHAGWRGLHLGILSTSEVKSIDPYYAFIGPAISKTNYEVSLDFRENFPKSKAFTESEQKLYFDLTKEAQDQLQLLFPSIVVECSHICTFNNNDFHSYRRNQTTSRNWNLYFPQTSSLC
jgi:copper oxidase (laccase) domain-containing protein